MLEAVTDRAEGRALAQWLGYDQSPLLRGTSAKDAARIGRPCHYCPEPATTWDHVIPRSRGGSRARANLVPACVPCNGAKDDQMPTCDCPTCWAAIIYWQTHA